MWIDPNIDNFVQIEAQNSTPSAAEVQLLCLFPHYVLMSENLYLISALDCISANVMNGIHNSLFILKVDPVREV